MSNGLDVYELLDTACDLIASLEEWVDIDTSDDHHYQALMTDIDTFFQAVMQLNNNDQSQ